ncbi:Uncharacterised protein [Anaerococcus prevotii]|uniref:Uncharacterized protein n=1 Tax=Anaerococcus prevotii (strain ATCC 9321 / DSM 20548 / JCM 6508 / NCTC 11806 / PC1) TaxID=525919 RepID=C7RH77_ANAPD|nr:hypothetical protein [Anaerococcus prevotii]ACV28838.1 hypothetical protein Apre_0810 [Anaerococcus prevotii DSM 20548]SUU94513.1 Uncharacterised protein [Anaerococcus prevotii]
MEIKLNNDEMATLTAIILAIGDDVENGLFDQGDGEMAERAKKSFTSLSNKVLMANFKLIESGFEGVMDAEILEEE